MGELQLSPRDLQQLPPMHLRAPGFRDIEGRRRERIPTPMDTRTGLIDRPRLIREILSKTLLGPHKWPSHIDDIHHDYWRKDNYPMIDEPGQVNPGEFRNLRRNLSLIPRAWHNWIHLTTEEPVPPSAEAMQIVIELENGIGGMHEAASLIKQLDRDSAIGEKTYHSRAGELYYNFLLSMEEIRALPEEFHTIDLAKYDKMKVDDLREAPIRELGKQATMSSLALTTRIIRQDTFRIPRNLEEVAA